jgi:hypothetical protein
MINIPHFQWNVTDNVMSEEMTNMNTQTRTTHHRNDRTLSGEDFYQPNQPNLDRFDMPACPVCFETMKGNLIQPWIEFHIREHGITRPIFQGPFKEPEASDWFRTVYLPWLKEKFGVVF